MVITAFASDLFNHYIKKLPNANEVMEHVVMWPDGADRIKSSKLNDQRKKMDRLTLAALYKIILQSLCCDVIFSDYEMFPSLQTSSVFQGPKEVKRAWFKEHETYKKMIPVIIRNGGHSIEISMVML